MCDCNKGGSSDGFTFKRRWYTTSKNEFKNHLPKNLKRTFSLLNVPATIVLLRQNRHTLQHNRLYIFENVQNTRFPKSKSLPLQLKNEEEQVLPKEQDLRETSWQPW